MSAHYNFRTSGNPLVQALWMVGGVAVLVAAVLMGALVLAVLLALGAVAAAVFAVRVWWLRRKIARGGAFNAPHASPDGAAQQHEPRLIEAEYTVVNERDASEADERDASGRANRRASR